MESFREIKRVMFGSGNPGKLSEVTQFSARYGVEILSPIAVKAERQIPDEPPDVVEDADEYVGNSSKKARAFCQWSGVVTLADDSGLEVDALDGAPGIHSARFGGPEKDFSKNIDRLLSELSRATDRSARFRSVLWLQSPGGAELTVEATLEGSIGHERVGVGGFGYDPVFIVDGFGRTLAELKAEDACFPTHRIKALEKLWLSLGLTDGGPHKGQ